MKFKKRKVQVFIQTRCIFHKLAGMPTPFSTRPYRDFAITFRKFVSFSLGCYNNTHRVSLHRRRHTAYFSYFLTRSTVWFGWERERGKTLKKKKNNNLVCMALCRTCTTSHALLYKYVYSIIYCRYGVMRKKNRSP